MEEQYIILRDEFPVSEERVKQFEENKGLKLPKDYRDFILEYNGGVVEPNYPKSEQLITEIFPIERFYSIQDIEFGVIYNQREISDFVEEDVNEYGFDIEFDKLLFIGICDRGNIHLYCGENGYGEIYYSNYSGGLGLEKTGLASFSELLNSLTSLEEEWSFDKNKPSYKNWKSDKIFTFEYAFYWEEDIKEQSLKRFDEVLSYYGNPNQVHKYKEKDVVGYYLNYPHILKYLINSGADYPEQLGKVNSLESLKFLVSKGASIDGLLNATRNVEVIKYLVKECGQDLNNPFEGKYPLLDYTNLEGGYSDWSRNNQYLLVQSILELGYDLNLEVADENGQSVSDRIKLLEEHHKMYMDKYMRR